MSLFHLFCWHEYASFKKMRYSQIEDKNIQQKSFNVKNIYWQKNKKVRKWTNDKIGKGAIIKL